MAISLSGRSGCSYRWDLCSNIRSSYTTPTFYFFGMFFFMAANRDLVTGALEVAGAFAFFFFFLGSEV